MRFDSLTLKAFGHFTNYELEFDENKNFHLIYGPNEAGKSTTLRSITNFLYGFPNTTNDSFLHGNQKLRISGKIRNANGDVLAFTRRKGRKNTVLDENENPLDEKLVEQFIGRLPESQFTSMYALNHETLRKGGEQLLQSGGSAGEGLFAASSGIHVLRKIMEELLKETGNLYKKTGSVPKLNKLLNEEKELNKKLQETQLKIQTWKNIEREYEEGKKELDEIYKQIKELQRKQSKLLRIRQMLPKISMRTELLKKIAELGNVPNLPDDVTEQRTEAVKQLEMAKTEKDRLEREIESIKNKLENIFIPKKIFAQSEMIDRLYREVQTYENLVNELPEIIGKYDQLHTQVLSLLKEIDRQDAELHDVEKFRLSTEVKETLNELIRKKPTLDHKLLSAKEDQGRTELELKRKEEELRGIPELPSLDELESIIDKVKRSGSIEEDIEQLKKTLFQLDREIREDIDRLTLWEGTKEQFRSFTVSILTETINIYEKEFQSLEQKLKKVQDQIASEKEKIEECHEQIRNLESLALIPSEEQLVNIRETRDKGWKIIRKKLQTGEWDETLEQYTNGEQIETVYEKQVKEADEIADKMRIEAEKVGQKNKLLNDIKNSEKKLNEMKITKEELENELESLKNDWISLWEIYGFTPLTPAEMKEWLTNYENIKKRMQEYDFMEKEWKEKLEKKDQLKRELIQILNNFITVSDEKTLSELLTVAEDQLKKIRELANKQSNLKENIQSLQQKLAEFDRIINMHEIELQVWHKEWENAIQQTEISTDTSPEVAEKLLNKYENCIERYDELLQIQKRQHTTEEKMKLFEEKVNQLIQSVDQSFEDENPAIVVNNLYNILQKAKEDDVTAENLKSQLAEKEKNLQQANEDLQKWERVREQLCKLANCKTLEELIQIEAKFIEKRDYFERLAHLEEEMIELGDGKSIEELIDEAKAYHSDDIDSELHELERKLGELEKERQEKDQAYGVVKNQYEEMVQGQSTHSVQLEQEKNSIHAQIVAVTEQYVQLKLASILLQKGIEEYRNQNQSPILNRAGDIFRNLTLQSFIDLTIDYNDKDEAIIMGVRENGEKVPIEGMSDGTTDQLYLALRLAYLEKNAKEHEPIPFIVDDILVHFDDDRSKETLKVLLELSKHTQIIFFTHHAHLLELMEEIANKKQYQVIELSQQEAVVS